MGNTCDVEDPCCSIQQRRQMRKSSSVIQTWSQLSQKDLVQIKKYPIADDYAITGPPIGKGSFGSVYRVANKQSGMVFAAKKIPLAQNLEKNIQEIIILKQLDHPNIIRIIDVYEEELFVYVVMEMCNGGELFDRIVERGNISEATVKNFMQQLLSAVAYCHMNKVIHRDLKPENIMLVSAKEDNLKIIDFGASAISKKGESNSLKVGSVYYIAPEVLNKNYSQKCDVWSLGVILYIMLSGCPPFNGQTDKAIFAKILQGKFSFPEEKWAHVSSEAKDLIKRMLEYNPEKRISARQALSHPWILLQKAQGANLYLSAELASIKQFCNLNKFKENITTYISHNLTTAENLEKMRSHFQVMDVNGDGRISWREFEKCYVENMLPIPIEELRVLFKKLDKNSSGFIDYSEFITSTLSHHFLQSKQTLKKAFDMIDKDKDGFLNKQEILFAMGGMEETLYDNMMQECDINRDGLISLDEFMEAMLSISQSKIKAHSEPPGSTTRVTTKASGSN